MITAPTVPDFQADNFKVNDRRQAVIKDNNRNRKLDQFATELQEMVDLANVEFQFVAETRTVITQKAGQVASDRQHVDQQKGAIDTTAGQVSANAQQVASDRHVVTQDRQASQQARQGAETAQGTATQAAQSSSQSASAAQQAKENAENLYSDLSAVEAAKNASQQAATTANQQRQLAQTARAGAEAALAEALQAADAANVDIDAALQTHRNASDIRYAPHFEGGFTLRAASQVGYSSASESGRFAHLRGGSAGSGLTYSQALASAAALGVRLPTIEELEAGVAKGSGNGFDAVQCWTCSPVPGQPGYVYTCQGDGTQGTRQVRATDDTATANCRFVANVDVPDIKTAIHLDKVDNVQAPRGDWIDTVGLANQNLMNPYVRRRSDGEMAFLANRDGNYPNLRARGTTKADVGLGNVENTAATENATPNTIMRRNSEGDVWARLFRSSHSATNSDIAAIYTTRTIGGDYMRPSTPDQVKAALGVNNVANVDQRNASNLTSGTVPAARISSTGSRTLNSGTVMLQANGMFNHCNSGDHDGRYYTKAQVDSAISSGTSADIGAVNSYAILYDDAGGLIERGDIRPASALLWSGLDGRQGAARPVGSWKLMSHSLLTFQQSNVAVHRTGLWKRVA